MWLQNLHDTGMPYLISLNPMHLENIAHAGLHDLYSPDDLCWNHDLHGLHNLYES